MECETNDCRKEKRGCKGCYYNKSADEMFKELGYTIKEYHSEKYVVYGYKNRLMGDLIEHTITFHFISKIVLFDGIKGFGIEELQAINKKAEELGWK